VRLGVLRVARLRPRAVAGSGARDQTDRPNRIAQSLHGVAARRPPSAFRIPNDGVGTIVAYAFGRSPEDPMSRSGTQPGLLISELMSGDGPHIDMAESFVLRRCDECGTRTTGELAVSGGRWYCARCLGYTVAAVGAAG